MSEISQPLSTQPCGKNQAKKNSKTKEPLLEISRKFLTNISASDFHTCHEYLAAVRLARNMTKIDVCRASQSDASAASGVSLPTISKIESGVYGEPGFKTMIRLARGYGIPLASLERFFN